MVDRLPEAVRQGRRGGHAAGPTNKFTEHRAVPPLQAPDAGVYVWQQTLSARAIWAPQDLSVADVNAALATLAFLTPADDLPTIMKALAGLVLSQ
jgi:hypothetical protein